MAGPISAELYCSLRRGLALDPEHSIYFTLNLEKNICYETLELYHFTILYHATVYMILKVFIVFFGLNLKRQQKLLRKTYSIGHLKLRFYYR